MRCFQEYSASTPPTLVNSSSTLTINWPPTRSPGNSLQQATIHATRDDTTFNTLRYRFLGPTARLQSSFPQSGSLQLFLSPCTLQPSSSSSRLLYRLLNVACSPTASSGATLRSVFTKIFTTLLKSLICQGGHNLFRDFLRQSFHLYLSPLIPSRSKLSSIKLAQLLLMAQLTAKWRR